MDNICDHIRNILEQIDMSLDRTKVQPMYIKNLMRIIDHQTG